MIQPTNHRTGLRPVHTAGVVVAVVVAAIVAYAAFGFIVGTIAFLVKLAIVVGIAALAWRFFTHRSRRSRS